MPLILSVFILDFSFFLPVYKVGSKGNKTRKSPEEETNNWPKQANVKRVSNRKRKVDNKTKSIVHKVVFQNPSVYTRPSRRKHIRVDCEEAATIACHVRVLQPLVPMILFTVQYIRIMPSDIMVWNACNEFLLTYCRTSPVSSYECYLTIFSGNSFLVINGY
ncbi:hypothetical protein D915_010701 [Fasciola hepatica]|uniref:Uncharacterized protein n=1 Tax=Fasciola hepatica TaxID=6192 RepID=A0A4E0QVC7_FASHE|nr:hypothetical protein D915_010701 [Fasciola hepatica]